MQSRYDEYKSARSAFFGHFITAVLVLGGILLFPKDQTYASSIRLYLTVGFFGFAIYAVWSLTDPLINFIRSSMLFRYERGGDALSNTIQLMSVNLASVVGGVAWTIITAIAFLALDVLSVWPQLSFLKPFQWLWGWGWFLGIICIPLIILSKGKRISQVLSYAHGLREQIATMGVEERTEQQAETEEALFSQPAVMPLAQGIDGTERFKAGGYDWQWDDFYKSVVVFGQTGSGKTICVLNALIDGLLASTVHSNLPPSGLILDPKGDFLNKIGSLCRKNGRASDLVILDPGNPRSIRWNPLDNDDDELEIAARFAALMEILGQKSESDSFWADSVKTFMQHAIVLLRSKSEGEPPSLVEIHRMAANDDNVSSIMAAAELNIDLDDNQRARFEIAKDYFIDTWFDLEHKVKSNIRATFINMLSPFLAPPYSEVFSGKSDHKMNEIIDKGMILYVHMPIADREMMSRVVNTLAKLSYFREVLKRPDKDRQSFFFCDEFQSFLTVADGRGDADFFERSRQSRHANIIATQNRPAFLKRAAGKAYVVDNLLGNCATKIFLRNSDRDTNEYASKLFGEGFETVLTGSQQAASMRLRGGGGGLGVGGSTSRAALVKPEEFTRLAVPSKTDGIRYADTIVHAGARSTISAERLKWIVHPLKDGGG